MGILVDGLAICLGGLFGCKLHRFTKPEDYRILGIGIMIVSLVGFFENMYYVAGQQIASANLILVLLAYIAGCKLGQLLKLEERLSSLGKGKNPVSNAFMDASLFFGIGGMQISGPVALAIHGDNTQLLIKSIVDLPFAIAFGSAYGKIVSLSALPVAGLQLLIFLVARLSASVFHEELTMQLCAIGYILLFFSGLNLTTDGRSRINNINMLPGMLLVILFHILRQAVGVLI